MCAVKQFRRTFKKVRRELSKSSGFGFGFSVKAKILTQAFREEMEHEHVPATPERVYLVQRWVARATRLGGAS